MEDMDDVRRSTGVVADLSGWRGISAGKEFEHMKITSKERVFDENGTEVQQEKPVVKHRAEEQRAYNSSTLSKKEVSEEISEEAVDLSKARNNPVPASEPIDIPKVNSVPDRQAGQRPSRPGVQEAMLNPNELKSIAVKLLPTVDKVSSEDVVKVSERAINLAFTFLRVWNEKIVVE